MGCDADALAGADPEEDGDADAVEDADEDEDADAGALWPASGTNGSCDVMCRMAARPFAGADVAAPAADPPPVAVGVLLAGVVTDGEAVLDDEPELFSTFGSWKASTPANKANSPMSRSFLRRSAALRAATRRVAMCVVLMNASSHRQTPRSKSRIAVRAGTSPARWPHPSRCR